MNEVLRLIQSTESSLRNARENLNALHSMRIEHDVETSILPVLEVYREVDKALAERKEALLRLLVKMTILIQVRKYHSCIGPCFTYVVVSHSEIRIEAGDERLGVSTKLNARGDYTLARFANGGGPADYRYMDFCSSVIWNVTRYIKDTAETQSSQLSQLKWFVDEIVSVANRQP